MNKVNKKPYQDFQETFNIQEKAQKEYDALSKELEGKVNALIEGFKAENQRNIEKLTATINACQNKLKDMAEVVVEDINTYVEDRSERWHDSERADVIDTWLSEWENLIEYTQSDLDPFHFEDILIEPLPELKLPPIDISEY